MNEREKGEKKKGAKQREKRGCDLELPAWPASKLNVRMEGTARARMRESEGGRQTPEKELKREEDRERRNGGENKMLLQSEIG